MPNKYENLLRSKEIDPNKTKQCPNCLGYGETNIRYVEVSDNDPWNGPPTKRTVKKSNFCTQCEGKGYLELKTMWV